ncbi:MAG: helix-turn-helix transcriptional regulator [Actinomycetales bacterium]
MNSVKKDQVARAGPRPARIREGRRLSATRAFVLETLQSAAQPTALPGLVAATGLHANTVREHLDALRGAGLAHRVKGPASGRGRPAWLYEASDTSLEDPRPEYAGLASALAQVIVRTSPHPAQDARRAGVDWGRRLAADSAGPASQTARSARRQVTTLFATMGFAPEPDSRLRQVRLTRCPLLEAARRQPDIVCSVHRGIAEGMLQTAGAPDGVELLPFAEPGACLLRFTPHR